ncbi:glucosamine-6-phosphate deaminase [Salicibibacter cibarius]|uniref:Glucosamine-6-phosphate deaminase n=1 Tax=Salicibibacter cibarius TaxID=2743000 RepID=A0A7T6Z217_9BACI|nr:glucosamine-6-phosphate deaminase [Salicibibacter cibarius]QQK74861.1 glucosamine-6-phosphate deaminase [Salicibibacter cibarius]
MDIQICKNYENLSTKACAHVSGQIAKKENSVLGLATGGTPEGMYKKLVEQHRKGVLSFQQVTTFNLDEYIGLPANHPLSYRVYMKDRFFSKVDLSVVNTHLPDGQAADLTAECARYEALLREAGGVDIQVLGLGHNGHIGFNEPGTPFASTTHIVELDGKTREANARYFDKKSDVPKKAITMGIETILAAGEILVLISGADKAEALRDMLYREMTTEFPATALQQHPNVTILADEQAAKSLHE